MVLLKESYCEFRVGTNFVILSFLESLDDIMLPELLVELEGFVALQREGVEGSDGDVTVGLEVAALDAEGGRVLVEVAAGDLEVDGEPDM
ncbi:hypothetical protein AHAS_Ahas03G0127000 [Arachis hypogaea]